MKPEQILRGLLTLAAVVVACALAASAKFYVEAMVSPYFAFALLAATIIHLRTQATWKEAAYVAGAVAGFALLDFMVLGLTPKLMAWPSFTGLGSVLVMAIHVIWERGEERRRLLLMAVVPAVLFAGSDYFASDLLQWTEKAQSRVFDLYLLSFDISMYFQIPALTGQWFQHWRWLRSASLWCYVAIPVSIAFTYAGLLVRRSPWAIPSMIAFLCAGPLGIVFYNIFPAIGPAHLLGARFPWQPITFEEGPRLLLESLTNLAGPRNAMPSLHLAWVLLAWWYSRGLSFWERGIALVFLIFAGLATVGTGEHYFADLIVAIPFCLFLQGASAVHQPWKNRWRLAATWGGLGGVAVWLLALRYLPRLFWLSPGVPWILFGFTLAICSIVQARLAQDAVSPIPAGE